MVSLTEVFRLREGFYGLGGKSTADGGRRSAEVEFPDAFADETPSPTDEDLADLDAEYVVHSSNPDELLVFPKGRVSVSEPHLIWYDASNEKYWGSDGHPIFNKRKGNDDEVPDL